MLALVDHMQVALVDYTWVPLVSCMLEVWEVPLVSCILEEEPCKPVFLALVVQEQVPLLTVQHKLGLVD